MPKTVKANWHESIFKHIGTLLIAWPKSNITCDWFQIGIAPHAPTGVKAVAISSTKIEVTWDKSIPRTDEAPVVAYTINYFPTNGKLNFFMRFFEEIAMIKKKLN